MQFSSPAPSMTLSRSLADRVLLLRLNVVCVKINRSNMDAHVGSLSGPGFTVTQITSVHMLQIELSPITTTAYKGG